MAVRQVEMSDQSIKHSTFTREDQIMMLSSVIERVAYNIKHSESRAKALAQENHELTRLYNIKSCEQEPLSIPTLKILPKGEEIVTKPKEKKKLKRRRTFLGFVF
ncbi:gag-pol [Acrasis kona]|uniref:Gag-pol n=1 Tax=Acrasis kona TaxID=1008807 RepID=A0AAW2Z9H4_9EUKA